MRPYVCSYINPIFISLQLPVDSLTVKVVLPEGALVIAAALVAQQYVPSSGVPDGASSVSSVGIEGAIVRVSSRRRWGLLDGPILGGKPVVVLEASHAMTSATVATAPFLMVRYSLPHAWAIYKPMLLAALLFAAFFVVTLLSRLVGMGPAHDTRTRPTTPTTSASTGRPANIKSD